jgi:ERCC4-type nuclease
MILLDRRIGSSDLYAPLRARGLPVELTTLGIGDVCWLGRGPSDAPVPCGVEIKRIGDLLSSITSGRLSGYQLPKLVREYAHVWLVVEGRYRPGPDGLLETRQGEYWTPHAGQRQALTFAALEGYLTTLEIRAGLHLRRTFNRTETVALISSLYQWWTGKAYEEHKAHVALRSPILEAGLLYKPSLKRRIAAELPGIGVEKSGTVATHFPTVRALIEASPEEWIKIPGIGKILANRIVAALNEQKP